MFIRDPGGRVVQEITGGAGLRQVQVSLQSQYDAVGNRTSLQYSNLQGADGGTLSYSYDPLNRLVSLAGFAGGSFGFSFDPLSRRTGLTRPNGVTSSYTWDAANQMTSVIHSSPSIELSRIEYTYNAPSLKYGMTDTVVQPDGSTIGGTHSYSMDSIYQLVSAQHPASEAAFNPNERFSYDSNRNRLSDRLARMYVYDAADRIISDSRFDYVFDADGNMAQKTERATGLVTRYTHDAENRLVRVDFPGRDYVEYSYDPMGRRIQKSVSGVVTKYAYDGSNLIAEYDTSATLLARYTHATSIDEPLAMERGRETYTFQTDGLGSVVQLANSLGSVVQTYAYDAYGQMVLSAGSVTNHFTFTGREQDLETGLYYYRARYYDPAVGRFLENDPLGVWGYVYCGNSPINFVDPSGEELIGALIGGVVGGIAGGLAGGWRGALAGAAGGAVFGLTFNPALGYATAAGLGTLEAGVAAGAAAGALSGGASSIVHEVVKPCGKFSATEVVKGSAVGAITGAILGPIGSMNKALIDLGEPAVIPVATRSVTMVAANPQILEQLIIFNVTLWQTSLE